MKDDQQRAGYEMEANRLTREKLEAEAARDHLRGRLHRFVERCCANAKAYDVRKVSADVRDEREAAWRAEALSEAFIVPVYISQPVAGGEVRVGNDMTAILFDDGRWVEIAHGDLSVTTGTTARRARP